MIRVNLLHPNGSFFGPVTSYRTRFAQANGPAEFPHSPAKINFVPLFIETSSTIPDRAEGALIWELVRLFDSGCPQSERVLLYLAGAEAREPDVWIRDDIRIAWKCVLNAALGESDPWGFAFWSYFGKTYKKALVAWAERDRQNQQVLERCAAIVRDAASKNAGRALHQTTTIIPENVAGISDPAPNADSSGAGNKQSRGQQNLYDSARAKILEFPAERDRQNQQAIERCAAMVRAQSATIQSPAAGSEEPANQGVPYRRVRHLDDGPSNQNAVTLQSTSVYPVESGQATETLYDSARAKLLEFPSPKDRKRAA